MTNYTGKVNGKYGIFNFCHFDEFIGLAMREYGEYSDLELTTILKFINKGDIVFDIGANIGCFSVPLAKQVGSEGKVYAFEPQPFINKLLKKNIQENNLDNVKIIRGGLGFKKKILQLEDIDYSSVGNFGGVSLHTRHNTGCVKKKTSKKHKIKLATLNDFMDIPRCDFLKIDVELMELDVLKGGKGFIKNFRPIMWIENHREYPNCINKYLLKIGYKPFWATTMFYNPNNYFVNTTNYYFNVATSNILAIPQESTFPFSNNEWFNQVIDEYTEPMNVLTR